MKKCKQCGEIKEFSEFYLSKEGYRQGRCRICEALRKNKLYNADKNIYKLRAKIHDDKGKKENREFIESYKANHPCKKCGENDPCCLDFHHLDPTLKSYSFGRLKKKAYAKKTILAEINKCIILCANCHRKLHAKRFELM
jgi:hypothetical protein